ncbi:hypothetical protein BDR03DRAFT_983623 [Suillus americanus]|nr:hypothetical protein BDR03DRAFT_983623 [Suillus americanus]
MHNHNFKLTSLQAEKLMAQQQVTKLLERGIGIWPTQLPQYAEVIMLADNAYENTSVLTKEIDNPQPAIYGNYQELVHLLGGTYYHHTTKHVIAWLEDLNGELLFGECIQPGKWGHKRLELEAQYWKHFNFFPHQFRMESSQMNQIGTHLATITMMLCMPITIGRIRSTSIDGVLNGVEVNSFIDGFSSQAKSQIALARWCNTSARE